MPRKFESINPEVLEVTSTGRRAHCKLCGDEISVGTIKLALNHNGTRLSFCCDCVIEACEKILERRAAANE